MKAIECQVRNDGGEEAGTRCTNSQRRANELIREGWKLIAVHQEIIDGYIELGAPISYGYKYFLVKQAEANPKERRNDGGEEMEGLVWNEMDLKSIRKNEQYRKQRKAERKALRELNKIAAKKRG